MPGDEDQAKDVVQETTISIVSGIKKGIKRIKIQGESAYTGPNNIRKTIESVCGILMNSR